MRKVSNAPTSSLDIDFREGTYPVQTKQIFIRTKNSLCVAASIDLILGGRRCDLSFSTQQIKEILTLRIQQYILDLSTVRFGQ